MTETISESSSLSQTSSEEAKERARGSGMTKGTAGTDETASEYKQGAAGTNKYIWPCTKLSNGNNRIS